MSKTMRAYLYDLPVRVILKTRMCATGVNTVFLDGVELDFRDSLEVRNHSETGFSWGYGGSGPSQMALAILLVYLPKELALSFYQDFKLACIGMLPQTDLDITINLRSIMDTLYKKRISDVQKGRNL